MTPPQRRTTGQFSEPSGNEQSAELRVWGGCGVEDCRECFPLYNEANEPITDNFGRPL